MDTTNFGQLIFWVAIGIVFQYLIIFLAAGHANSNQNKKIDALMEEIKKLKSQS